MHDCVLLNDVFTLDDLRTEKYLMVGYLCSWVAISYASYARYRRASAPP